MIQGNPLAQDHSERIYIYIFFFFFTVTKVESKSILLPTLQRAVFVSFFHKLIELFLTRWLANFYQ